MQAVLLTQQKKTKHRQAHSETKSSHFSFFIKKLTHSKLNNYLKKKNKKRINNIVNDG